MQPEKSISTVDIHGDILIDVQARRRNGERKVLETHHLPALRRGGVQIQIMAVYVTSNYLPESVLRQTLRMIGALYEELHETPEHFLLVHRRTDLRRARSEGKIALVLGLEGAEPLDRDIGLVRVFHQLGIRVIGLTWNLANVFAQGVGEDTQAGLSIVGQHLLREMQDLGLILDLSHSSEASFWSALGHYDGPIVASHSNSIELCRHPRNLTDEQIKAIGERGGLIGLNMIPRFVGDEDLLRGVVRHAAYIRDVAGITHLALGPDFVNYLPGLDIPSTERLVDPGDQEAQADVQMPDVTLLPQLHQTFLDNGWSEEDTAAVFGGNALRYLEAVLPED